MVKKCVGGYSFNYHGEIIVPTFLSQKSHEDPKGKRIRFVKDWQPSLTLFVVYIRHFEDKFLK